MAAAIAEDKTGDGFLYQMFLCELDNHEYGGTGGSKDTADALLQNLFHSFPCLLKRGGVASQEERIVGSIQIPDESQIIQRLTEIFIPHKQQPAARAFLRRTRQVRRLAPQRIPPTARGPPR